MIISKCTAVFDYPVERLWDVITNNNDYSWRTDLKRIDIIDVDNFVEIAKNDFKTNFKITKKELYQKYEFDIKNANINGHWIGMFKELEAGKCETEFTEMIEVKNIIMKLFGKIYLKKQQQRYIKDLKNKLYER